MEYQNLSAKQGIVMVVNLSLYNGIHIKVDVDDLDYLRGLKDHLSEYVEGFLFMPLYKSGQWDGKRSFFNRSNKTFPYGLLTDFLKYHKEYGDHDLSIDPAIKTLFKGDSDLTISYNLKYKPRPYQQDSIESAIKYRNNIIVVGTAGGKSLILSYIYKILSESGHIKNVILVVPTINLVSQFKSDMIDYGLNEDSIGEVYGEKKEWNKSIVISTWQTLHNNINQLENFDSIFIDEVHQAKAQSISDILCECGHMFYRIGCTGTLPDNKADLMSVKSFLGPVSKTYPVSYLIQHGFAAPCKIDVYNMIYKDTLQGDYNEVKDLIFAKNIRLCLISDIIHRLNDENILILVSKIEKEGNIIEKFLKERHHDKQIKFIHGKISPSDREKWRKKCINEKNIVLISVFQLFQLGVNIPNLKNLILASSSKSKIRTLQSIGRSLRKSNQDSATIHDIVDTGNKSLMEHAKKREAFYINEDFVINKIDVFEK